MNDCGVFVLENMLRSDAQKLLKHKWGKPIVIHLVDAYRGSKTQSNYWGLISRSNDDNPYYCKRIFKCFSSLLTWILWDVYTYVNRQYCIGIIYIYMSCVVSDRVGMDQLLICIYLS